jgi:surface protein
MSIRTILFAAAGVSTTPALSPFVFTVNTTGFTSVTPAARFDFTMFSASVANPITVYWGDGTSNVYTTNGTKSKVYAIAGIYDISVVGNKLSLGNSSSYSKRIIDVKSWGTCPFESLFLFFRIGGTTAYRLPAVLSATDMPIFAANSAFTGVFTGQTLFNDPRLAQWDTANLNGIQGLFQNCTAFNVDISGWNTANVTIFTNTFAGCPNFNQPIGSWNTGKVTNWTSMFNGATNFNQDISQWNTSSGLFMNNTFVNATAFNNGRPAGEAHSDLNRTSTSGWRTGNVENMTNMFSSATAWNGDISEWCVTKITTAPTGFDTGATSWTQANSRPVWGSCPIPN